MQVHIDVKMDAANPGGAVVQLYFSQTARAATGAVKRPSRFSMGIHFVWGFCMGVQGA
jgi:hypothetical protein